MGCGGCRALYFCGKRKGKIMNLLKYGDVIGIISPSWVANQNDYEKYAKGIERLGVVDFF